jgi:dihydroorotase
MKKKLLLVNASVVNEGEIRMMDVLLDNGRITKLDSHISDFSATVIDVNGNYLIPGMIDDQVHFRDPGLTYKADLYTESRAAVAGGVTSFMDMPNTIPNTLTRQLLEEKYAAATCHSMANFSFFMGLSSSNWEEALRVDTETVCGLTDDGLYFNEGEILANQPEALERIFSRSETLVALHSEDEGIIRKNYKHYLAQSQGNIPMRLHANIRSTEACEEATKRVLAIQAHFQNRLHFFHISTGKEALLFPAHADSKNKRVTSEACVHHLWFVDSDYERLGGKIKWNPSIKTEEDRRGLIQALAEGRIDIIASDHAPHAWEEKIGTYEQIKSGAPILQHSLPILFELANRGELSIEQIVEKTSHRVADIYRMVNRGYIREGYFADLVEVDVQSPWQVTQESLHYKCGWSPVENEIFQAKVKRTFVNGTLLIENDQFVSNAKGMRLLFEKIR